MARSARSSDLESRTSRLKLKPKRNNDAHWLRIAQGVHLGYYRQASSWWTRKLVPNTKRYVRDVIGNADDYRDADGVEVFDFYAAQDRARKLASEHARAAVG